MISIQEFSQRYQHLRMIRNCAKMWSLRNASFIMREGLRRLYEWAKDWQMLFNVDKCSVMHMGKGNKKFKYKLGGVTLRASEEERDLGVIMHCMMTPL